MVLGSIWNGNGFGGGWNNRGGADVGYNSGMLTGIQQQLTDLNNNVYCIQGIKRPRVDTERPVQIMYQWFSTKNEPRFTPMMITQSEWCKANIFTAPLNDTRMSILNAFCGINNNQKKEEIEDIPLNLINGGNNAGRKK